MQYFLRTVVLLSLIFSLCSTSLSAQDRIIKGRVIDEEGKLLPEAGVSVKGTEIFTSTNTDGVFSIQIPAGNDVYRFLMLECNDKKSQ